MVLQPEDNLTGEDGHGWKGVWKWCTDHSEILESFMKDISPRLDMLIVRMGGKVNFFELKVVASYAERKIIWYLKTS